MWTHKKMTAFESECLIPSNVLLLPQAYLSLTASYGIPSSIPPSLYGSVKLKMGNWQLQQYSPHKRIFTAGFFSEIHCIQMQQPTEKGDASPPIRLDEK